jgi:hypothetical protein
LACNTKFTDAKEANKSLSQQGIWLRTQEPNEADASLLCSSFCLVQLLSV